MAVPSQSVVMADADKQPAVFYTGGGAHAAICHQHIPVIQLKQRRIGVAAGIAPFHNGVFVGLGSTCPCFSAVRALDDLDHTVATLRIVRIKCAQNGSVCQCEHTRTGHAAVGPRGVRLLRFLPV